MNNNQIDETEVPASDEIKGEIYSTVERWIILIVMYVISLIICIVYLFKRIDAKQFSWPIFILCLIYSSFFVTLNAISVFDIAVNNEVGMKKFFEMVSIYYKIFNWVDKALGYVVFNLLIAIMESGYSLFCKKFFDYWI